MTRSSVARLGQWLCLAGASLGAIALIGWIAASLPLTRVFPGQPPMMPNAAVGCLLIGLAGALRLPKETSGARLTVSLLATVVVLLLGVLTLAQYAWHIDLGIDQVFLRSEAGPFPGRPSPPTALGLGLLALGLLLLDTRLFSVAGWLIGGAWFIAFTAMLGQTFGTAELYQLPAATVIGVAVPTALSLFVTSLGILCLRPDIGAIEVATSPGPGGTALRRLATASILAPALLGFLIVRFLPSYGLADVPLVIAILAASITGVSLVLLNIVALRLERSHQALQSMRQQTHALFEQAADGIFVADLNGRYTDVNTAGARMLGYSREEIVGKTILDLIPPGEAPRLDREKLRMIQGEVVVAEWLLRRKNGTYLPVEVSAKILPDGRWQGIVRDISERKQLEERLRLAEATSSGIIQVSADAIICIDEAHRITLFNRGAEAIFGYASRAMIGAPLDTLVPDRFRADHRKQVDEFAAGPEGARRLGERDRMIYGLRASGEEFPADSAISKLDVDGRRILTIAMRDISEQKRIESAQRFLAETGLILARSLDYEVLSEIAHATVRHIPDRCIVDIVNEDGEMHRLAVESRDPSQRPIDQLFLESTLDAGRPPAVEAAVAHGKPFVIERLEPSRFERVAEGDDHLRALSAADPRSIMVLPLIAHERLLGVITLMSSSPGRCYGAGDLQLAEELARRVALWLDNARLYRQAEHAIAAREDMLGIVAHDLRNPLATIVLQASLMRTHEFQRRPVERAEIIERAATRMNHIIEDLLDVTRLEAGQLAIERTLIPARAIVAEAVQAHEAHAEAAGLDLRMKVAWDLPDVYADRERLLQVFENLIGNALKFTPTGGKITVRAELQGSDVVFRVQDTGRGIAEEDLPHLFAPFWQSRSGEGRGAGLGLAIVKGIVKSHGGSVEVESRLGAGSTFSFSIPTAMTG